LGCPSARKPMRGCERSPRGRHGVRRSQTCGCAGRSRCEIAQDDRMFHLGFVDSRAPLETARRPKISADPREREREKSNPQKHR